MLVLKSILVTSKTKALENLGNAQQLTFIVPVTATKTRIKHDFRKMFPDATVLRVNTAKSLDVKLNKASRSSLAYTRSAMKKAYIKFISQLS